VIPAIFVPEHLRIIFDQIVDEWSEFIESKFSRRVRSSSSCLFRRRFARRRGLILHNRNVITPDNELATASAMALDGAGFETERIWNWVNQLP